MWNILKTIIYRINPIVLIHFYEMTTRRQPPAHVRLLTTTQFNENTQSPCVQPVTCYRVVDGPGQNKQRNITNQPIETHVHSVVGRLTIDTFFIPLGTIRCRARSDKPPRLCLNESYGVPEPDNVR